MELVLKWVIEEKELSFDVETTGLDWHQNYPIGYVFCINNNGKYESIYIPVRHAGGGNAVNAKQYDDGVTHTVEPCQFELDLALAFKNRSNKGLLVIGHNIKFDAHMCLRVGVALGRNLVCTQNNEALLDEYVGKYSLDDCSKRYDVPHKLGDELYRHLAYHYGGTPNRAQISNFWRLSGKDKVAVDYAVGDGITTLALYDKQLGLIKAENLEQVWKVECDLIWTLVRMERLGLGVDTGYLARLRLDMSRRIAELESDFPTDFNPASPIQVRDYMKNCGHTDWPYTEKGNPSLTAKWLSTHPEGKRIVRLRQMYHLNDTFITPLLERHSCTNNRVHTTFNQNKGDEFGTVSGRLSSSNPNLQQVPKHNKELAVLFRRAFIADKGHQLCERDYSQMEPRLFAHYSKEQRLIDGYMSNPPIDVHTIVANLTGLDRETMAKRMNMGIFTGMYPKTFAQHLGVPLAEATALWHKWFSLFPGVGRFQERAKKTMAHRGYVRTLLGRRARLESVRFAYRAVSRIIQGSNADIIKYKMVELDKITESIAPDVRLVLSIHDSILFQFVKGSKKQLNELINVMHDVQGEPFNLRVPQVTDGRIGKDWARTTFDPKWVKEQLKGVD